MMVNVKAIVMKFGGAALETPKTFFNISKIISDKKKKFNQIIVVVSAMGNMTDHLTHLAYSVSKKPRKRELDMLISSGERISMSLLAMNLSDFGIAAKSLTGSQSGIITCAHHNEAKIIEVRPSRIRGYLEKGIVVIVAGFQGVSLRKEITTLGRGGSDTSAVALGAAIGANRVEFYKDVEGIYSEDPKKNSNAKLIKKLKFSEALKLETPLHHRSILLAQKNGLPLHIKSFNREQWKDYPGTWVVGPRFNKSPQYESIRPC